MNKSTGFLIGLFYLIAVFFGVLSLAMGQLRSSSGPTFDTWRLNYEAIVADINNRQNDLNQLRKDSSANRNELEATEECVALYDEASGSLIIKPSPETVQAIEDAKRKGTLNVLTGDPWCTYMGLPRLKSYKTTLMNKDTEYKEEILKALNRLESGETKETELRNANQEFAAFTEMEKKWITRLFIVVPYDLLVLLLVMSMGLLGGIIRLLRDYGAADRNNPTTKDYFFVPLIGAVVAIGGYILAKTGLLLLSSTKGETSLSPFMVGLVGMISGLLAKEVVDRIATYGHEILKRKTDDTH